MIANDSAFIIQNSKFRIPKMHMIAYTFFSIFPDFLIAEPNYYFTQLFCLRKVSYYPEINYISI